MHFDIVSSIISLGALATLMGLWMLIASFLKGELYSQQMRIWAISCLMFGVAYVLFASRDSVSLFWSLIVGNSLFALGYGGFSLAISRVFDRRFPFVIVGASIFVCILILFMVEIVYHDSSWRVIILAGLTIVPWIVSLIQCFQEWLRKAIPHSLAISLFFASLFLVSISRVAYAAYHGNFGYEGLPSGPGYLLGTWMLLVSPIVLTVGFFILCSEQARAIISKLADSDPLTGVLNRRSVLLVAENRFASVKRRQQDFACVMIDLDQFKLINDDFGHAAGDRVLVHVTSVLAQLKRAEDLLGRLGGDEFVVFLPYCDLEGAERLATLSLRSFSQHSLTHEGHELPVSVSFGIASHLQTDTSLMDILNRADKALYDAKAQGGNVIAKCSESTRKDRSKH